MAKEFDLAVLGAGPGGYVAAIRASQLGLKTALIEKENLGGVCLNWGCIPTKSLLKNAEIMNYFKKSKDYGITYDNLQVDFAKVISRSRNAASRMSKGVDFLIRHNKIDHFKGTGHFTGTNSLDIVKQGKIIDTLSAKNIIISTGGRPKALPGLEFDSEKIISSKRAMTLEEIPESLLVIGGGAIGVEFAYFYASFGTKVTIVEMMPHLLPNEDEEVANVLAKSFKKQKIKVHTGVKVEKAVKTGSGIEIMMTKGTEIFNANAERMLVAVGVRPNTDNFGLEDLGMEIENGFIRVDKFYKTSIKNIYAIGDCIGGKLLAHVASAEAVTCVEKIVGKDANPIDYDSIPQCTYCQPQVASIGLTEQMAKDRGYKINVGNYPFRANGKSVALGDTEGFVKLIFDAQYGELLGAHIIGSDATEIIAELGIAKTLESSYLEILKTVHAHPTLSEAIMEAAGQAYGEAIHI